jgi:hypothetical protein
MGLQWDGSEYELVLLPPGETFNGSNDDLPPGAINEDDDNELFDTYGVEFISGYDTYGKPYKFFKVNNPLALGAGAWKYAILENEPPLEGEEPLRVYMSKESDLVLDFFTDQERYYLTYDENNNPEDVFVLFTAILTRGGESLRDDEHTQTVGEPVDDALVKILVSAPDGQKVAGQLDWEGNGKYTIKLQTNLVGNYDVVVIASDYDANNPNYNNSEYLITTEHSFFVSPDEDPEEVDGRKLIQEAYNLIYAILEEYNCLGNGQGCNLPNKTKRDLNNAISSLDKALDYFGIDGDHLKERKGLNFYDEITSAVNYIYSYIDNEDFGKDIELAVQKLYDGSLRLAIIVRDEAVLYIEAGNCEVSNCDETLKNANSEIGKAIDESKKNNYVFLFNHLTNAWKFSMNILPFNPSTEIRYQLPENNHVKLQVYDILGNVVETLLDNEIEAGYHSIQWNAGRFASGVYFYRIVSGSFVSTKKLMLMK